MCSCIVRNIVRKRSTRNTWQVQGAQMTSSIQMKSLDIYREANDGRTTSSNASFDSCSFFVSSSHGDDDALHLNRNDNTNLATENGGTGHFTAACFRTVSLWLAGLKHIQGCQVVCRRSGGTPCVPCNPCTSLTTCTGRIPPVNAKVSFEVRVKPLYKNPCYYICAAIIYGILTCMCYGILV